MGKYCLFIDESGSSTPNYQPEMPYVLVGCAIEDSKREAVKKKADELKKKYWGKTSVVFHHYELDKNKNHYDIFRDKPELKEKFRADLIDFLHRAPVTVFVSIVDKQKIESNWTAETIIKKANRSVFFSYIAYLYSRPSPKGEIIIEASNSEKDKHYLAAFSYFLSPHCPVIDDDFKEAKDLKQVLGSIQFVTKHNNDIETQLADTFGYAAYCLYLKRVYGKTFNKGTYKHDLVGALKDKLFYIPSSANPKQKVFYNKVEPFNIFPN